MRSKTALVLFTAALCFAGEVCAQTQRAADPQVKISVASQIDPQRLTAAIKDLEAELGARAGVAVIRADRADEVLQSVSGAALPVDAGADEFFYQADERFAMCSTFKLLLCAAALQRGPEFYERKVPVTEADLLSYAPKTRKISGSEASILDLCHMFMSVSDNTAANLVLRELGGPSALTAFVRSLRDKVTRLDRFEPELNEAAPGDLRDTTTPRSMAYLLGRLLSSDALPTYERDLFYKMLLSNETSGGLLKAAAPAGVEVADRTGAGGYGTRGIAAVVGELEQEALVVVIYLTETKAGLAARDRAISRFGKAVRLSLFKTP